MSNEAPQRMILLYAVCYMATSLSGCSSDSAADPSPAAATEVTPTEPVSFESIPLSKDSSYESPPIPAGKDAGEVREFTALKIPFCWCPSGTFLM